MLIAENWLRRAIRQGLMRRVLKEGEEGRLFKIPKLPRGYYDLYRLLLQEEGMSATGHLSSVNSLRKLYQDKFLFVGDQIDLDEVMSSTTEVPKIYSYKSQGKDVFEQRPTVEEAMRQIRSGQGIKDVAQVKTQAAVIDTDETETDVDNKKPMTTSSASQKTSNKVAKILKDTSQEIKQISTDKNLTQQEKNTKKTNVILQAGTAIKKIDASKSTDIADLNKKGINNNTSKKTSKDKTISAPAVASSGKQKNKTADEPVQKNAAINQTAASQLKPVAPKVEKKVSSNSNPEAETTSKNQGSTLKFPNIHMFEKETVEDIIKKYADHPVVKNHTIIDSNNAKGLYGYPDYWKNINIADKLETIQNSIKNKSKLSDTSSITVCRNIAECQKKIPKFLKTAGNKNFLLVLTDKSWCTACKVTSGPEIYNFFMSPENSDKKLLMIEFNIDHFQASEFIDYLLKDLSSFKINIDKSVENIKLHDRVNNKVSPPISISRGISPIPAHLICNVSKQNIFIKKNIEIDAIEIAESYYKKDESDRPGYHSLVSKITQRIKSYDELTDNLK